MNAVPTGGCFSTFHEDSTAILLHISSFDMYNSFKSLPDRSSDECSININKYFCCTWSICSCCCSVHVWLHEGPGRSVSYIDLAKVLRIEMHLQQSLHHTLLDVSEATSNDETVIRAFTQGKGCYEWGGEF